MSETIEIASFVRPDKFHTETKMERDADFMGVAAPTLTAEQRTALQSHLRSDLALSERVEALTAACEIIRGVARRFKERMEKAEAELDALRSGAKVTYRIDYVDGEGDWHPVPSAFALPSHPTLESAKEDRGKLVAGNTIRIVEITTRERIIETPPVP